MGKTTTDVSTLIIRLYCVFAPAPFEDDFNSDDDLGYGGEQALPPDDGSDDDHVGYGGGTTSTNWSYSIRRHSTTNCPVPL